MRIRRVWLVLGSFCLRVGVVLAFSTTTSNCNSDVVVSRSYTIFGPEDSDSTRSSCLPVLHEIRPPPPPPPQDTNRDAGEDAADYEFKRRAFIFPNPTPTGNRPPEQTILDIRETSFGCGGLGATVWPSAIALACLLVNSSNENVATTSSLIQGKRVMELGSGCGLPTLVAKEICHARSILATDYWEESSSSNSVEQDEPAAVVVSSGTTKEADRRSLPNELFRVNLEHNIGSNVAGGTDDASASASVEHLDWHDERGIVAVATNFRPEVIIGSDLVYYPQDTVPLLRTLELLLHVGEEGAKEILLISPLRPAYSARKALPDFRARLNEGALGERCEVQMDELEMVGVGAKHGDEERHKFLRIRIQYVPNTTIVNNT